jgi:predicted RNase H-like HicB family nuclease
MESYTAKYIKIARGYMGQIIEWPEVVTEGSNLEECREMLRDALAEMIAAAKMLGPQSTCRKAGDEVNVRPKRV